MRSIRSIALLDWGMSQGIGFSQVASIGNSVEIGIADLINYVSNDQHTEVIILYMESITDPRSFMSAARNFSSNTSIQSGRTTSSSSK